MTLLLIGLSLAFFPGFSLHRAGICTLPAFIAMLVGMAISIRLLQAVTGKRMHVNCGGDYCRAKL